MKFDPLVNEIEMHNIKKMARILGPYSAAAKALEWASDSGEACSFFYSKSGALVAMKQSFLLGVGPVKNVEVEKHFQAIPESQCVRCLHCGKNNVLNQGLAKLAHLAKCTGGGARRNENRNSGS